MRDDARWNRIEEIFHEALALEPHDRAEYVQTACGHDDGLRERVESLLAQDKSLAALDDAVAARARIGPYQLVRKLGAGGMGEVYLAQDTRLGRQVAVKILPREFSSDAERRRRFLREAKAASALNHPNVVTVHDFGSEGEIDYLVMEYIKGKPLDRIIPHNGLKTREALDYAIQIAHAVAYAHAAGILHRDLKPANVIVTDGGAAKVLDFGLAKVLTSDATRTMDTRDGVILGTAAYMSPEQAEGKRVDARSDIFSFGSMLYEMVTGRRPFHRESVASTIAAIVHDEPELANVAADDVPAQLGALLQKCLRKEPSNRFGTMAEVKATLEQVRENLNRSHVAVSSLPTRKVRFVWTSAALITIFVSAIGLWVGRIGLRAHTIPKIVPLTTYQGDEFSPSFSPDGNNLAFAWDGSEERPQRNFDIFVTVLGGGNPIPITHDPTDEISPDWSPDGRFIAFVRALSDSASGVFLIPAIGGPERKLAEIHQPGPAYDAPYLSWFPDSNGLAVVDQESPTSPKAIFRLSVETGEKQRLTSPPQGSWGDSNPAVSPDGRALAFRRSIEASFGDLFLVELSKDSGPASEPGKQCL
jgi:eukaryotic-like serine/threonine-protein kinase